MDDGTRSPKLLDSLSAVRLSTGLLFAYALFLAFTKHRQATPSSPTAITSVVVASKQPRRALIATLLLFASFTYLLDGLIVLLYFFLRGFRQSYFTQWRGIELADVLGFLAFFSVLVIGIQKEKRSIDFWSRKRLKGFVFLAIVFDVAYLVLLVLAVRIFQRRPSSPGVPERPNIPGIYLPNFLHFLALDARLLVLFILFIVLFKPSTTYTTIASAARDHPHEPTPNTLLLPASGGVTLPHQHGGGGAYGTFSDAAANAKGAQHNGSDPAHLSATAPSGGKAAAADAKGYEADEDPTIVATSQHAEGSSSRSVHSQNKAKEDEPLVPVDPEIEDVPNPVTDDPDVLKTSYAATAAAYQDKERRAEDENADEEEGSSAKKTGDHAEHAHATESPTAMTFPSATRDDSSSLRGGVTFSQEAVDKSFTGEEGAEGGPPGIEKKRRRISSQNFKRIVKKISDIPRRQGSISSLGSAARNSVDGAGPSKTRLSREDSAM
ncbi:hypothetical protein FRC18_003192, partial [Serendipita sp. 400]